MVAKAKEEDFNPMELLNKSTVVQQCRAFNDRELDVRKCCELITKILYLLQRGEQLSGEEPTSLFFGGTKLLQNQDPRLRRLVYLFFRELSTFVPVGERIIVTSTLMNGMKDKNEINRANSIRVLAHVLDPEMFGGEIERKLKESVVEKSDSVASAALVAGMVLLARGVPLESLRRWAPEATSGLQSRSPNVQAHALALLWATRRDDRQGVSRLAHQLCGITLRSVQAQCLRLRIISRVIEDEGVSHDSRLLQFVENCLHHTDDAVNLEAARVICSVSHLKPTDVAPALSVLGVLLNSSKTPVKLGALRTFNYVAISHPQVVQPHNSELEALISDDNRSIATLALTTLLKTATDSNVDALMRQTTSFMTDMPDEFKIVVIKATKSLCLKFPAKSIVFMDFLGSVIGEEGGQKYKESIFETITDIIQNIPHAKEHGIRNLCEFIEDCEHEGIVIRILHFLGVQASSMKSPEDCIRIIYNRVVLDTAAVRSAAVDTLAVFGHQVASHRDQIITLLKRCLYDGDDEVRDRAALHLRCIQQPSASLTSLLRPLEADLEVLEALILNHVAGSKSTPVVFADLERKAVPSVRGPAPTQSTPSVIAVAAAGVAPRPAAKTEAAAAPSPNAVLTIPELAAYGPILGQSKAQEMTEAESDYVVTCVKHICKAHIILQFDIRNNVETQLLERLIVECDTDAAAGVAVVQSISAPRAAPHDLVSCYVVLSRDESVLPEGTIPNTLKFLVKEIDVASGDISSDSFDDEYQLEDLTLSPAALIKPAPITQFKNAWDALAGHGERIEMFVLNFKAIGPAVNAVIDLVNLGPCDNTNVPKEGDQTKKHTLLASGLFLPAGTGDDARVLCITNFALDPSGAQVHIRVSVRAKAQALCDCVMTCVG